MKRTIKSISEVLKSHRLLLLKLLITLQIVFLGFLFFQAVADGRYFLIHEDEVINYCSAKVFSETGSVRAESCISENVSRIGEMNWYGPGYSIMYGAMRLMFDQSPSLFIKIHFTFALITIILILFFLPISLEDRLLSGSILIFTEQFTGYIFTYFPESFHLLIAVIFTLLIIKIHQSTDGNMKNRFIIIFIMLVIVVSLSRVTTIFWLAGLIGVSACRKERKKMILVFAVGLVVILLFMRYFTAPPYAGGMQKIDRLFKLDILDFISKTVLSTLGNTFRLLKSSSIVVYILLVLVIMAAVRWWQTKHQILGAALLISISLLGALMAYYSAGEWYFLKQSAILLPLLIISLILTSSSQVFKYTILILSFLFFPLLYKNVSNSINEHKKAFQALQSYRSFQNALNELPDFISEQSNITILWLYTEYDFGSTTEAILPFSTKHGNPILYTTNIVSASDTPEVKFERFNKLKINYVLSRTTLSLPHLQLVHATEFYNFYRIEK